MECRGSGIPPRRCVIPIEEGVCDRRSRLFLPCHSTVREQFCMSARLIALPTQ